MSTGKPFATYAIPFLTDAENVCLNPVSTGKPFATIALKYWLWITFVVSQSREYREAVRDEVRGGEYLVRREGSQSREYRESVRDEVDPLDPSHPISIVSIP